MLSVELEKRLGDFSIAVTFEAASGTTALFGSSGSGKTTIVNMIAGLVTPDRGRISFEGMALFDSAAGINVPAHRRNFGYVFQEGRLFPHMSVAANLEYGRWMLRHARDHAATARVVELLGIGHLLARRPGALSGGERQRIAIGRALLMQPKLLLLDEPLASLDRARKLEILPYLTRLRDEGKVPMIYVSHQAGEIVRIASQVVRPALLLTDQPAGDAFEPAQSWRRDRNRVGLSKTQAGGGDTAVVGREHDEGNRIKRHDVTPLRRSFEPPGDIIGNG
jgi:molybdate transport system ATP-binding protein